MTTTTGKARKKLGLALSGGGFRAAFFHIGVLSRLAELGILRHVDVISTVSGGSIVGAFYYLHLKKLLESKADDELTDADLEVLTNTIEEDFLSAVQRNVRLRAFSNLGANVRMVSPRYSRSDRIGELLDRWLYQPAVSGLPGGGGEPVRMRDLPIHPASSGSPPVLRETREFRIPNLIVNSTNLITGHAWRFEPTTMGEPLPRDDFGRDVDRSLQLPRPPTYEAMTRRQTDFLVGEAVAASSAVPGLFHPMPVSGLYENLRLQLVDGGVADNEGVEALIEANCELAIVSDAGGQLIEVSRMPSGTLGVALRSSSIQYGRVRQLGLERLHAALGPKAVALVHTRSSVRPRSSDYPWMGPDDDPVPLPEEPRPEPDGGIHPEVQKLLADIRTDLDSFTDVEAKSLMYSGYCHTIGAVEAAEEIAGLTVGRIGPAGAVVWDFFDIQPWAAAAPTGRYRRRLARAKGRLWKPLFLSLWAWVVALLAFGPVIGALAFGGVKLWPHLPETIRHPGPLAIFIAIGIAVGAIAFVFVFKFAISRASWLRSALAGSAVVLNVITATLQLFAAVILTGFAWLGVNTTDRVFLRTSRVESLGPPPTGLD